MKKVIIQEAETESIEALFENDPNQKKKRNLTNVVKGEIWIINDCISNVDCQNIIDFSEKKGYQQALLNVGYGKGVLDKSIRDCSRVMIDDVKTANFLAQEIRPFIPLCQEGALYSGMNERFRILKYSKNQNFAIHMDGIWSPSPSTWSVFTILFYLNTVEKGGQTRFEWKGWESGEFKCSPEKGKAVIFRQQGWWHEGCPIEKGLKYALRNDLMYESYTQEKWLELKEKNDLICGMCGTQAQGKILTCGHLFLHCGCKPYNSTLSLKQNRKHYCHTCRNPIDERFFTPNNQSCCIF